MAIVILSKDPPRTMAIKVTLVIIRVEGVVVAKGTFSMGEATAVTGITAQTRCLCSKPFSSSLLLPHDLLAVVVGQYLQYSLILKERPVVTRIELS